MVMQDPDGPQRPLFIKRLSNGVTDNMNVNGSITPEVFKIAPPAGQKWRIARWMLSITDQKGFDVGTFGANGLLTNGIMPRIKIGGVTSDMLDFGIRSNGDIAATAFDMDLYTFGNTDDILTGRLSFTRMGQFIRLDGDSGDELQVVIRDDLTTLTSFYIQAQGYIE